MTPLDPYATGCSRADVRQQRCQTVLSLAMAFVVVLLLLQLWLLVGTIEGVLGGAGAIAFPATLVSGVCCLGTWWLWFLVRRRGG